MDKLLRKRNDMVIKNRAVGAVIGASEEAIHAITTARKLGVYVIALDGNKSAKGLEFADNQYIVDIKDYNSVCDILIKENVSFIIPVPIGRCLATIGYANTKLNLPGISIAASELCTDKLIFHETMSKNKLRNIQHFLVNRENENHIIQMNLPVIIKPRYGSGNHGVILINRKEVLINRYKELIGQEEEYICETAVDGTEYGMDGVVIEGHFKLILLRMKIITQPPMRQCLGYYTISNEDKLYQEVEAYINRVIKVLGLDNCIVHSDLMINSNEIFVIEIAGRPSGHHLHDILVPLATGIDMIAEIIKYFMGEAYQFGNGIRRNMALHFFGYENCIIGNTPSEEELVRKDDLQIVQYKCNLSEGMRLQKVEDDAVLDRGYFIVEGNDYSDLFRQCNKILDSFEVKKR